MPTLKKTLQTLGSIAAVGGMIASTPVPAAAQGANPCAPKTKSSNPCGPKAKKAANPCAAKGNPCAPKGNPCAARK
ncbi:MULTISPECIES: hypothetical protein [unclassified Afipia]|uniref:hypothetical protein n=1 Tax=unclassified Afipia TaxID=2642050 RepID=UPI000464F6E5|nr:MULTISPECIES: hypothetical protein [unclassified Afipia]